MEILNLPLAQDRGGDYNQSGCKGAMGVQSYDWVTIGILKFRVHFLVFILFGWSKVIRSPISCPLLPLALECIDQGYTAYVNGETTTKYRGLHLLSNS